MSASNAVACRLRLDGRPVPRRARSRSTHHDAGALAREQDRGGAAVADGVARRLAGADDDRDFVFEPHRRHRAKPSTPGSSWTPSCSAPSRPGCTGRRRTGCPDLLGVLARREPASRSHRRRWRRGAARRPRGPARPRGLQPGASGPSMMRRMSASARPRAGRSAVLGELVLRLAEPADAQDEDLSLARRQRRLEQDVVAEHIQRFSSLGWWASVRKMLKTRPASAIRPSSARASSDQSCSSSGVIRGAVSRIGRPPWVPVPLRGGSVLPQRGATGRGRALALSGRRRHGVVRGASAHLGSPRGKLRDRARGRHPDGRSGRAAWTTRRGVIRLPARVTATILAFSRSPPPCSSRMWCAADGPAANRRVPGRRGLEAARVPPWLRAVATDPLGLLYFMRSPTSCRAGESPRRHPPRAERGSCEGAALSGTADPPRPAAHHVDLRHPGARGRSRRPRAGVWVALRDPPGRAREDEDDGAMPASPEAAVEDSLEDLRAEPTPAAPSSAATRASSARRRTRASSASRGHADGVHARGPPPPAASAHGGADPDRALRARPLQPPRWARRERDRALEALDEIKTAIEERRRCRRAR